jgi:hypothetical protein
MNTVITVDHERQTLWARIIPVGTAKGDLVLRGFPKKKHIIKTANVMLPAPADPIPNYNNYSVRWTD